MFKLGVFFLFALLFACYCHALSEELDEAPAGHAEGIEVEQVTFTNGKPSNASMENHEDLDGYGTEDNSDSSEDIGDDENYPNKNEYESDEGEEEMSIDEPAETDRDENEDGNEEEEGNDDGEDDNVDGEEEEEEDKDDFPREDSSEGKNSSLLYYILY